VRRASWSWRAGAWSRAADYGKRKIAGSRPSALVHEGAVHGAEACAFWREGPPAARAPQQND